MFIQLKSGNETLREATCVNRPLLNLLILLVIHSADIKRLTQYWKDGYDWRKQEARLNQFPQFKTVVEIKGFGDLDMHFLHVRSEREGAIPLCFVHGCEYAAFQAVTFDM